MEKTITITYSSTEEAIQKINMVRDNLTTSCFVVHWNNGDVNEYEEDEEMFFADSYKEAENYIKEQIKDESRFIFKKYKWVKITPSSERWDGCSHDYEGEFYYIQEPLDRN